MARLARKGIKSFCLQKSGENLLLVPWGMCPTLLLPQPWEQSRPWCPDTHWLCVALPGDHPGILDLFAKGIALAVPWLCSPGALYSSTLGSAVQFGALVWGKLMCLELMRAPCNPLSPGVFL